MLGRPTWTAGASLGFPDELRTPLPLFDRNVQEPYLGRRGQLYRGLREDFHSYPEKSQSRTKRYCKFGSERIL